MTDEAFPGEGAYTTQVWRLKQLEYTWLGSLMSRYEDVWTITRESLAYTLATLATLGRAASQWVFKPDQRAYELVEERHLGSGWRLSAPPARN